MNKVLLIICLSFVGCSSMNVKPTVGVSVGTSL